MYANRRQTLTEDEPEDSTTSSGLAVTNRPVHGCSVLPDKQLQRAHSHPSLHCRHSYPQYPHSPHRSRPPPLLLYSSSQHIETVYLRLEVKDPVYNANTLMDGSEFLPTGNARANRNSESPSLSLPGNLCSGKRRQRFADIHGRGSSMLRFYVRDSKGPLTWTLQPSNHFSQNYIGR